MATYASRPAWRRRTRTLAGPRVAVPLGLLALVAVSLLIRTREISIGFWIDEGISTGIADRASGLMEDLKLIEVDEPRQEAILRSEAPAVRGDDRLYYEIHLRGLGHATARRYKANRATGARREQVAFALTHEMVAKLAGDIAG